MKKVRIVSDNAGRFLVLSKGAGGAEFDYHQARYGPETIPDGVHAIVMADPLDGCDDKAYRVS